MSASTFHIAMYPWLALGHLTPFLHLANKLAKKGNRISFLAPSRTIQKLKHLNLCPELITLVPIAVPHIKGLPPGAETTSDVPHSLYSLIMTAMDRTENDIEALLADIKPDIVFFDFTHWIPRLARQLGIKSIYYCTSSPATISYSSVPPRHIPGKILSEEDLMQPPLGYPDPSIRLHCYEARKFASGTVMKFGSDVRFCDRHYIGLCQSDALGFRTCKEIEGSYIDYLESQFRKPVLLSGPVIPEPPTTSLEEKWFNWLERFEDNSVIYCAFGSECSLKMDQFQELMLGLELTGMPFLAALKPPLGASWIEDALPEGFEDRVQGKGVVHGGWVQQQMILEHPSVGCFVTHCGSSSLVEALINKCQLILLPQVGDQIINARMMSKSLKVGVEVEKDDNGFFTKESVCRAVTTVMDETNELGKEVRVNHARIRDLLQDNLESSYIDKFSEQLRDLCNH